MSEPIFIPQARLETWVEADRVGFADNVLTLLDEGISYELSAAVKITALIDGEDCHGLLGEVCSLAALAELGAEQYRDSVILGDTAYLCEEGFLGSQPATGARHAGGGNEAAVAPEPVAPPARVEAPCGTGDPAPQGIEAREGGAPVVAPSATTVAEDASERKPDATPMVHGAADDGWEMELLNDFILKNL